MCCTRIVIEPQAQSRSVGDLEASIPIVSRRMIHEFEHPCIREVVEVLEDSVVGSGCCEVDVRHCAYRSDRLNVMLPWTAEGDALGRFFEGVVAPLVE
jgi:hypothetical protein